MSQQNENQNSDTTYTKLYVEGLPWATNNEGLRSFFEQFGEVIHVNIVCDRQTRRSKGYGFVTFRDAESATRALVNRNPIIDGRIANCKLASTGANVNHNQANQTVFARNDLCYTAPSFWQSQQQPLTTFAGPNYWDQFYLQYYPQFDPLYYPQFDPQHNPGTYQHYPIVNTNLAYSTHQSMNNVDQESSSLTGAATESN